MSDSKRLCLVDGSGYIYRAFYAIPPMTRTRDNTPTNAVYGFSSMMMHLLEENKADCLAVVFDASRRNFRNQIYSQYKANRKETPAELVPQFPLMRQAVEAFGVPSVEEEGFEADDLIASYTRQALADGYEVLIVTADKDMMQLMEKNVSIYDPMKKAYRTEQDVFEKFGVPADKVVQVQALMGDKSDNVLGVFGIGEKAAAQLISQFSSLDGIYANLDKVEPPRRRLLLEQGRQDAYISLKLVTLDSHAPLPKPISSFCCVQPDIRKIQDFLNDNNFKSLVNRVPAFVKKRQSSLLCIETPNPQMSVLKADIKDSTSDTKEPFLTSPEHSSLERAPSTNTLPPDIVPWVNEKSSDGQAHLTIQTSAALIALCNQIKQKGSFCFYPFFQNAKEENHLVGIALSVDENTGYYIPLEHKNAGTMSQVAMDLFSYQEQSKVQQVDKSLVEQYITPLFLDKNIIKISHQTKHQLESWNRFLGNVQKAQNLEDIMVMNYVLTGSTDSHLLSVLGTMYLNQVCPTMDEFCGKGQKAVSFADIPLMQAATYAVETTGMILRLYHLLKKKISQEDTAEIYKRFDRPLISVLMQMENRGILVDEHCLKSLQESFGMQIAQLEKEIFEMLGFSFNINSPAQLGEVLFDKMKLEGGRKNRKTGTWSTDSDILETLAASGIEVAQKVLDYRSYSKFKSTYVDALLELADENHRVHTTYAQTLTSTGRLSSLNPNLQNIPVRSQIGRQIRSAFVPKEGHMLLSADYSQVELRLMADVANVTALKEAFAHNADIHAVTASQVFGVPIEGMNPLIRRQAKAINFGIIYGISSFGLAAQLGISRGQAKQYIDSYFARYPQIDAYMKKTVAYAAEHGYVLTPFGRKCYVKGFDNPTTKGFASRAAINAPIQGGAADIIKLAMAQMETALKNENLKAQMLLQVHDELIFEVPIDEVEKTKQVVKSVMENVVHLSVPFVADVGVGINWTQAH